MRSGSRCQSGGAQAGSGWTPAIEGRKFLGQDRLARSHLRHHRIQAFAARRHATIGRIIAEPAHLAHAGIVVGQMQRGYVTGHAIHQQPRAPLPHPTALFTGFCRGFVAGQSVIEPHGASHHKAAVGHVVRVPSGPFLEHAVNEQGANLERVFAGSRAGGIAGLGVRHGVRLAHRCAGATHSDCEKRAKRAFRRACMTRFSR